MLFCSKCGTEVQEGINFCGKCGSALNCAQNPSQTDSVASRGSGGTPFVMEKEMLFRVIGKLGYIFVIIGFCMPIACDVNGFKLADFMFNDDKAMLGLLTIMVFISAIVGIIIGIILLTSNIAGKKVKTTGIGYITMAVCIASGLIVYLECLIDGGLKLKLQSGAYMILFGWIIALAGELILFCVDIKKNIEKYQQWELWCLAVSPIVSSVASAIVTHPLTGEPPFGTLLLVCLILAIFNVFFIKFDERQLRKSGFKIGIAWTFVGAFVPAIYLFVRAAKTDKTYLYAVVCCILWVLVGLYRLNGVSI